MTPAEPGRTPGLDQVAALARGLKPIARFVSVASFVAGAGLTFALQGWLHMDTGWIVASALMLGLPALLYAWLWWLLYALGELPERVHGAVGTIKEIRQRPSATSGFRKLGRALRDVWNVLDEADNVWLPISAAFLLANPIGLLVLVAGFACALVLWLAAAIVGVAYAF